MKVSTETELAEDIWSDIRPTRKTLGFFSVPIATKTEMSNEVLSKTSVKKDQIMHSSRKK